MSKAKNQDIVILFQQQKSLSGVVYVFPESVFSSNKSSTSVVFTFYNPRGHKYINKPIFFLN